MSVKELNKKGYSVYYNQKEIFDGTVVAGEFKPGFIFVVFVLA